MIPVSDLLQESVRFSNTLSCRVDIWRGTKIVAPNVPLVGGSLTSDRTSKVRTSAKLDIALIDNEVLDVDNKRCRVRIWRGAESLGRREIVQLAELRVDDISRQEAGLISLDCSGLEQYVMDARFLVPRTPPYGQSTVLTIIDLIKEVLPTATVVARNTYNRPVQATAPWDKDRWDAIDVLAESIGAEVYANYQGYFIIQDVPSLVGGVPVITMNEGDEGLLVSRKESETRDQVYNAVSVSNESSDGTKVPVWAWAYDSDPNSPTYYYGDFGPVPRFYVNVNFTTVDQCQGTANRMLADALAENKSLSFTSAPVSFLEVSDLAEVDMNDGSQEVHMIDKLSFGLGVNGQLSADTRSTKVAARENDV